MGKEDTNKLLIMEKEFYGQLLIFVSCIFGAVGAILVKNLSSDFDGYFIAWFRFLVGLSLGTVYFLYKWGNIRIVNKRFLFFRGLFGSLAMILYYLSIELTSSGRGVLLNTTYPLFVAIFGYLVFHEKISMKTVASILVCAGGVYLVFYDGSSYPILGSVFGILSGALGGMAIHYIRKASMNNRPIVVYLAACTFGFLITMFSAKDVLNLTPHTTLLLVTLGVVVFTSQLLLTFGFRFVSTTRGSVTMYSIIPMTLLLGLAFGEKATNLFYIGTIVIVFGLFINSMNK